jgi:hypothetical protein
MPLLSARRRPPLRPSCKQCAAASHRSARQPGEAGWDHRRSVRNALKCFRLLLAATRPALRCSPDQPIRLHIAGIGCVVPLIKLNIKPHGQHPWRHYDCCLCLSLSCYSFICPTRCALPAARCCLIASEVGNPRSVTRLLSRQTWFEASYYQGAPPQECATTARSSQHHAANRTWNTGRKLASRTTWEAQ